MLNRISLMPLLLVLSACSMIAKRDDVAIKATTDIRVEAEMLIDKAVQPPQQHAQAISFLRLRASQAMEYAKTKDKNELTIRQWKILMDEKGHLLGGFLVEWERRGAGLSPAFVSGAKHNILAGIDEIIKLEKAK